MKKIVSAVTVASLLAGAAFADVSVAYTGKNNFEANGGDVAHVGSTDCLALQISNDIYGARVDFDAENGKGLTLDEYYGWMTFSGISTTITAGVWNSRYVNRVTTDKRGVDFDREDFELFKPGVINPAADGYRDDKFTSATVKTAKYNVAIDSDNLTRGNLAMVAAYTNTSLPGTLMIKAGLVDVTGKSGVGPSVNGSKALSSSGSWAFTDNNEQGSQSEKSSLKVSAGFVGEVAYRQDNLFNVNLAVRSYQNHTASAALFFSPLMIENLQATAGLTFGFNGAGYTGTTAKATGGDYGSKDSIYKNEGTVGVEFAADLRLRYAFSDRFSLTTMHNFSSYLDCPEVDENGGNWNKDDTKWVTNDFAMWNMLNLTYDFAEGLTAGFTVQHLNCDMDRGYIDNNHLWISPNVTIAASEKVKFTVVSRIHWQNMGADKDIFSIKVPVIFTFNY